MEQEFWEQAQQYAAEIGYALTTAECYRLIDEIEEDMDWNEGDEYV